MERKPIPNHPEYYADRKGRIWRKFSNKWRIINPVTHHDGYQYTHTGNHNKRELTQRLVCAAFKGSCGTERPLCIRKAKKQQPRRVRSQRYLKWGTHDDKRRKGGHRLTREQQLAILKSYNNGRTQISLAKEFNVTQPAISYLVNGKTKLRNR